MKMDDVKVTEDQVNFGAAEFHLPHTKEEYEIIKRTLIDKYGLIDEPQTWVFVISQIQNVKMPDLCGSYDSIVSHYKRWKIGAVLQDQKNIAIQAFEAILKEKTEQAIKELSEKEAHSVGGKEDDLPIQLNGDDREVIPEWSDVQISS